MPAAQRQSRRAAAGRMAGYNQKTGHPKSEEIGAPWKGVGSQRVRIPSGNCRSSRKQPERFEEETRRTEALWIEGPPWVVQRACRPQRAVNVGQASKRLMRKPTRPVFGEGCQRPGSERTHAPVGSAEVVTAACTREGNSSNTGNPAGGAARANRNPARDRLGRSGWRRGP